MDKKGTVKISDFGLARDHLYQTSDSQIPIRWAAPEMLTQQPVTSKSDVFSFGIVLWEIFSWGLKPYVLLSNNEVIEHVLTNVDRYLLKKPELCPLPLYDCMQKCWALSANDRPTFKEILKILVDLYKEITGINIETPIIQKSPVGKKDKGADKKIMKRLFLTRRLYTQS